MLTNLPFALPDWMPGWMFLLLAVPVVLYLLAFLVMPFSVFGVKSRIELLEAQIEALHDELRMMSMRSAGVLPRAATSLDSYDDVPNFGHLKRSQRERDYAEPVVKPAAPRSPAPGPALRPPVPTPVVPVRERLVPSPAPSSPPRNVRRAEPRLD